MRVNRSRQLHLNLSQIHNNLDFHRAIYCIPAGFVNAVRWRSSRIPSHCICYMSHTLDRITHTVIYGEMYMPLSSVSRYPQAYHHLEQAGRRDSTQGCYRGGYPDHPTGTARGCRHVQVHGDQHGWIRPIASCALCQRWENVLADFSWTALSPSNKYTWNKWNVLENGIKRSGPYSGYINENMD